MQVFDQYSEVVTDTENALSSAVDSVMAGDDFGAETGAKNFWGGLFETKKRYFEIYKKYLSDDVLNAFYYNYLEHRVYGRPHFSYSTNVSLFVLPENVELLDLNDPIRVYAEDSAKFFTDATYRAMSG